MSVITVVPSHSLALISAYVSALTGHSAVTHMALPADGHVRFEQRRLGDLAVMGWLVLCCWVQAFAAQLVSARLFSGGVEGFGQALITVPGVGVRALGRGDARIASWRSVRSASISPRS